MAEKKGAAYIRKTLVSNERVLYVGKLHSFAYVPPTLMVLFGLFLIFLPALMQKDMHMETGAAGERVEIIKERAAEKLESVKKLIPEELLPYVEKVGTLRRVGFGFIFVLFGAIRLLNVFIKKKTVEQAITNKKVIKKRGMISVDTNELNLDRIESVKISQTGFDRIINRGRVLITGVGMEQIDMRGMYNPAELKKAILETIDLFIKK